MDAENVSADYDKGVLKIALPKKAEAKPKQIKVNVGSEKPLKVRPSKQGPQQSRISCSCRGGRLVRPPRAGQRV